MDVIWRTADHCTVIGPALSVIEPALSAIRTNSLPSDLTMVPVRRSPLSKVMVSARAVHAMAKMANSRAQGAILALHRPFSTRMRRFEFPRYGVHSGYG